MAETSTATPELNAPAKPPEAVPPSDPAEVVRLRDHAARLLDEKKKERERAESFKTELEKLKADRQRAETETLTEQQQYKTLWEQAQGSNQELQNKIKDLQTQLEDVQTRSARETLRAKVNARLAKDIIAPDQFYTLNQQNFSVNKDGEPVYLLGGVETDLQTALEKLKQPGSGYEHFFRPSGMGGMGSGGSPAGGTDAASSDNPYITGNITRRMQLEIDNPDLAARLKMQAQALRK